MSERIKTGEGASSAEKLASDIVVMQKKLEQDRAKTMQIQEGIAQQLAILERMRERILRENAMARENPTDEAAKDALSDSLETYSDMYAKLEKLRERERRLSLSLDGTGFNLEDAEEQYRAKLDS